MLRVHHVGLSDETGAILPSAIAFSRTEDAIVFGKEALRAPSDRYDLLLNWKLLLGKDTATLSKERAEDESLSRILDRYSLEAVAAHYFGALFERMRSATKAGETPQAIIGIPAITDPTSDWRKRYRQIIERAFSRVGLPSPKFFPEPFGVFQYHWNRQDFADIGRHQNVLIVDIGGGTTNVCFIQTTQHGRLARGGVNHIPHGVRSVEVGGANIDRFILERFLPDRLARYTGRALLSAAGAKERISIQADEGDHWQDNTRLSRIAAEVEATDTRRYTPTGSDLKSLVEAKLWPMILAIVRESVAESRQAKLTHSVDVLDSIVLAGGTCQMGLIEVLFRKAFADDPFFGNCRFLRAKDFACAVAEGLAIEAYANSRFHGIRPTRVSPYIQDDIRLQASHRRDGLETPRKLRARTKSLSTRLKDGILLSAPMGISPLVDEKFRWSFSLVQRPREIFIQFEKLDPHSGEVNSDFERPVERIKLAKKSGEHSPDVCLDLTVKSDGFADVSLEVSDPVDGPVVYKAHEIDLHDLNELNGSLFYGVDFGTSSTLVASVNVNDISSGNPLPERYTVEEAVDERANLLADRAQKLMQLHPRPEELLMSINDQIVADYVYHSNRIEGSQLSRGQTASVLQSLGDTRTHSSSTMLASVAGQLSFIDDQGDVRTVSRPIRDAAAAVNLRDAFSLVREWANDTQFSFTPFRLRELHGLVTRGDDDAMPGSFRIGPVKIEQTSFVPPDALHVPGLVEEMFQDIGGERFKSIAPLIQATEAHARFVSVHPFADGNGRIARLIANYFLWKSNLPGILLPWENRDRYYDALEECNSRELINRGNLSDLGMLFCDLFEDVVMNLEETLSATADVDSPIVEAKGPAVTRMTDLLARLTKQKSALDFEAQYRKWVTAHETVLAGVREAIDGLSRGFNAAWGGRAEVWDFPIIDEDTYRAIRERRRFSRTWFFRTKFFFPKMVADFAFFFGPNSLEARTADEATAFTASLHISRFDTATARYVPLRYETWSRVQEIVHNGSSLGVLVRVDDESANIEYGSEARVENWFAILVEDVITKLAQVDLSGSNE